MIGSGILLGFVCNVDVQIDVSCVWRSSFMPRDHLVAHRMLFMMVL